MGLKKNYPFYEDFVMIQCKRMDEVKSRAFNFIKLEEDKKIQKRSNPPNSYDKPNRNADSSAQRSYKLKPYSKPDHHRVNALKDEGEEDDFPKIFDYCFSMDVTGIIYVMQDLGDKTRWPKKGEKSTSLKDKSNGVHTMKTLTILQRIV